jgi:PadR family transcriptional regulator PadR
MANPPDLDLVRGTLDLIILKTLSWGPMHGFGIGRWIEQLSGNDLRIEEGSLDAEWGYTENNRKAKYYRLTPLGRRQLTAELSKWERYTEAIAMIVSASRPAAAR